MKFKKGDEVVCVGNGKDDNQDENGGTGWKKGFKFKVGDITEGKNNIYWPGNGGSGVYENFLKLAKCYKQPKINFLLQYELDEDPWEEFSTIEEVDERIRDLVANEDTLKKDSMVVYEVKSKKIVTVETKITKKLAK